MVQVNSCLHPMVQVNSCLHPQTIYRRVGVNPRTGKHYTAASVEDLQKWGPASFEAVPVRCGKCYNCIKAKSRGLMARCVAESRMHKDSAFVTLTVDDDNVDDVFPGRSLLHRPYQLWFKRLRKMSGVVGLKYMMCGEYGELSMRPHYHCVLFGLPGYVWQDSHVPDDYGFGGVCKLRSDNPLFGDCWPYGNVYVGDVTPASVAYVCGYTCKQLLLGRDDVWYKSRSLAPEYVKWSRRPGLGRTYFEQYGLELVDYERGECGVDIDGHRYYAGRYFADWLRLTYPDHYDRLLGSYEQGDSTLDDIDAAIDRRSRRTMVGQYELARSKRF